MLGDEATCVNAQVGNPTREETVTIVDSIVDYPGRLGTLTVLGAGAEPAVGWAELHQRARRMASVLVGAGVGRGGRVGLLGETSVALVTALQAVWLVGAAVTVLPRLGRRTRWERLHPVLVDADPDLVVTDARPAPPGIRAISLAELARWARAAPAWEVRRPDPTDLALLQYTSGSTRSPRGDRKSVV